MASKTKETKEQKKNPKTEVTNKWGLFAHMFDRVFDSIKWNALWNSIVAIPAWLKYLLLSTVMVALCYFTLARYYTRDNIQTVQEQVNILNAKINNVLTTNEYEVDMEYMIVTLYLLEEMSDQEFEISAATNTILLQHLKEINPDDPLIHELERSEGRLEQLHKALKRHFQSGIEKFKPSNEDNNTNP